MRGLPPPPPDVCRVTTLWNVNTSAVCSNSFWIFAPGVDAATTAQLETLLSDFFFTPMADLLGVVGSDVSCEVLRLSRWGIEPFELIVAPAPNAGSLSETTALCAAAVLTWRISVPRVGGRSHTFLPLSEDLIDSSRTRITSIGYSQLQAAARSFVQDTNTVLSPDGATCVLVTVSRSLGNTPRPASLMVPIELGDASPVIGTLRRRIRRGDPASSPF